MIGNIELLFYNLPSIYVSRTKPLNLSSGSTREGYIFEVKYGRKMASHSLLKSCKTFHSSIF